jgi:hypothetical protein
MAEVHLGPCQKEKEREREVLLTLKRLKVGESERGIERDRMICA